MRKLFLIVIAAAMLSGCASLADKITVPEDWCVKFRVEWNSPAKKMDICVCTKNLLPGLEAALPALLGTPDKIEPIGTVTPQECSADIAEE